MELRIVLLGKTGSGKSALGNTLLGKQVFSTESAFGSCTQKCQFWEESVNGRAVSVTDTPGLSDTRGKEEDIIKEIAKAVGVSCPGPHAVIIVLRCDVPFIREEFEAVTRLKAIFGEEVCKFLFVVFTRGDHYEVENDQMQGVLQKKIPRAPENLNTVLEWANNRFCIVSNRGSAESKRYFSNVVLNAILDKVVKRNDGKHFTNDMIGKCNVEVQLEIAKVMDTYKMSYREASRCTQKGLIQETMPELLAKLIEMVHPAVYVILGIGVVVGAASIFMCSVM